MLPNSWLNYLNSRRAKLLTRR